SGFSGLPGAATQALRVCAVCRRCLRWGGLWVHPVNEVVASIQSSLKSVADVNPTFMRTDEKAVALRSLVQAETQLVELRLRVLAAADDVAGVEGFRSAGAWLSHHARIRRGDAAAD